MTQSSCMPSSSVSRTRHAIRRRDTGCLEGCGHRAGTHDWTATPACGFVHLAGAGSHSSQDEINDECGMISVTLEVVNDLIIDLEHTAVL